MIIGAVSQAIKSPLELGQEYQGGVIAYFFKEGEYGYIDGEQHGIIYGGELTPSQWGCSGTMFPNLNEAIGLGGINTNLIVEYHNGWQSPYESPDENGIGVTCDIANNGSVAAVNARLQTKGGFNDWFLPSLNELTAIANNRLLTGIPHRSANHWASRNNAATTARRVNLVTAVAGNSIKTQTLYSIYCRYF
jgi:hypothetical protein